MNKYDILNGSDFVSISRQTHNENRDKPYAVSYIRQVLRGYVPKTSGNSQIFDEADKIVKKKLKMIQS
jgi:hypothetical protein